MLKIFFPDLSRFYTYDVFEKYDFNIDLLFIDAEGYDAEIAIDLLQKSNFRPIIIIEYVHIKLPSIKVLNNLSN